MLIAIFLSIYWFIETWFLRFFTRRIQQFCGPSNSNQNYNSLQKQKPAKTRTWGYELHISWYWVDWWTHLYDFDSFSRILFLQPSKAQGTKRKKVLGFRYFTNIQTVFFSLKGKGHVARKQSNGGWRKKIGRQRARISPLSVKYLRFWERCYDF